MLALLLVLLAQSPCGPEESTVVCFCKQGSASACEALDEHSKLRGLYRPRDPRFVSRAVDEQSHCGYQQWHLSNRPR